MQACTHTHTHATAWRSENSSQGLFLSFLHVGLRDWTLVTRLSAETPHQPNKIVFLSRKTKNQKLFLKNRSSNGLCHLPKVDEILCLGLRLKANRATPTSRRVFLTAAGEELERKHSPDACESPGVWIPGCLQTPCCHAQGIRWLWTRASHNIIKT